MLHAHLWSRQCRALTDFVHFSQGQSLVEALVHPAAVAGEGTPATLKGKEGVARPFGEYRKILPICG